MSESTVVELFLGVVVVMLLRAREVGVWQALVVGLFGYYLARSTFFAPVLSDIGLIIGVLTNRH